MSDENENEKETPSFIHSLLSQLTIEALAEAYASIPEVIQDRLQSFDENADGICHCNSTEEEIARVQEGSEFGAIEYICLKCGGIKEQ